MQAEHTFSVALIGSSGMGKTSFINRHKTGEFTKEHIPTPVSDESIRLTFHTNCGAVNFDIFEYDCGVFEDHIEDHIEGVFLMIDVSDRSSFDYAYMVIKEMHMLDVTCPTVLCGNKVDIHNRVVDPLL